jgi:hypothetical protein
MNPSTYRAARSCQARTAAGQPCRNRPARGALVCAAHSGTEAQVLASARRRLQEAAPMAIAKLVELVNSDNPVVAAEAATALLDRTEHGPTSTRVVGESAATEEG